MRLRIVLIGALGSAAIPETAWGQLVQKGPARSTPIVAGSCRPTHPGVLGSPTICPPSAPPIGWNCNAPFPAPFSFCPPSTFIGAGWGWPVAPIEPTVDAYFPVEFYPQAPPQVPLALQLPQAAPRPRRADPSRANELSTIGDRNFRAGDLRRATERYQEALRLRPGSAAVRVRLAQVALVRGQYTEAANRLREALAAEPDWLERAPDIQDLYAEPSDFKAAIDKLERHLQARPTDRDAWLVLGAQWFLSGRTRQAADVFLRLTDRKPDPALAMFLDASKASP